MYVDNDNFELNKIKWIKDNLLTENSLDLTYYDLLKCIQSTENKLGVPIGVIGSNKPDEDQYKIAENLGERFADIGLHVICGGRAGVMEAVCKGVKKRNGISIGIFFVRDKNQVPASFNTLMFKNPIICSRKLYVC